MGSVVKHDWGLRWRSGKPDRRHSPSPMALIGLKVRGRWSTSRASEKGRGRVVCVHPPS